MISCGEPNKCIAFACNSGVPARSFGVALRGSPLYSKVFAISS